LAAFARGFVEDGTEEAPPNGLLEPIWGDGNAGQMAPAGICLPVPSSARPRRLKTAPTMRSAIDGDVEVRAADGRPI
jgi:hypothetical protein